MARFSHVESTERCARVPGGGSFSGKKEMRTGVREKREAGRKKTCVAVFTRMRDVETGLRAVPSFFGGPMILSTANVLAIGARVCSRGCVIGFEGKIGDLNIS